MSNEMLTALGQAASTGSSTASYLSAISVLVATAVAVVAAVLAYWQVRLATKLRYEQAQPHLAVFIEPSGVSPHLVDLVVKNFGSTIARNISIEFEPALMRSGSGGASPELVGVPSHLPTLVPGQEWRTFWDFGPARKEQEMPGRHTARIACDGWPGMPRISFVYDLDWAFFFDRQWVQQYGIHDAAKALREIERHMRGWREMPGQGLKVYVRDGDKKDEERFGHSEQQSPKHEKFLRDLGLRDLPGERPEST